MLTTLFGGWRRAAPVLGLMAALLGGQAHAAIAAEDDRGGALYVDCGTAAQAGSGTQAAPLTTLAALNRIKLQPGARVLFRRGSVCQGSFTPAAGSSGSAARPIMVGAYGDASLPRPLIAAGCIGRRDPGQALTEAAKSAAGVNPYHSLCESDGPVLNRAAIHLRNVEHWEIKGVELTNDGLSEGERLGLLVELQDFGVASHFRINDVYVHHVRGYLKDPAPGVSYKATGGILFNITRQADHMAAGRRTSFDDVVVENSEIYHVDGIGLSNRSGWMCRPHGAPCGDLPPYAGKPAALQALIDSKASEFTPSTRLVFRNNKIHDIGGDGLIVRTASAPLVEGNLLYDIWMRAPFWSAGAWAINTDDAVFRYNEVHHVRMREQLEPSDGMAFDADMGTWRTVFSANYSHDNAGGLVLFCACGKDGLGNAAKVVAPVVDNNLSVNDGRRAILAQGADQALVQNNVILVSKPGLAAPLIENVKYPTDSQILMRNNVFYDGADQGALWRTKNREGSYAGIAWSDNVFIGFAADQFFDARYRRGAVEDRVMPAPGQDPQALARRWFDFSGFATHRYAAPAADTSRSTQ